MYNSISLNLVFILLIAYFIAGITGNACLFLQTKFENPRAFSGIELRAGDSIYFNHTPPNAFMEISLDCDISTFKINQIKDNVVIIDLFNNMTELSIHQTWVIEGEKLTTCNFQHKLMAMGKNVTIWKLFHTRDAFSYIKGQFLVRGIYKTYIAERLYEGTKSVLYPQ